MKLEKLRLTGCVMGGQARVLFENVDRPFFDQRENDDALGVAPTPQIGGDWESESDDEGEIDESDDEDYDDDDDEDG